MKAPVFFLLSILFMTDAGAQTQTGHSPLLPVDYTILSTGFGKFYPSDPGHDISATFPYTVKDIPTGSSTQQTFSGGIHGKFTKPSYMLDLLKAEFVRKHHSIDMGVGLFQEKGGDHGFYLKGGYNYILSLGSWQIKPGLDFYYLNGSDRLGSIDNRQKEISLFGMTASDQFTVEESDGNDGTTDVTYDAYSLTVNYNRYSFLTEPKITLAPRPRGSLTFSVEAGWMFQLAQKTVLQFTQQDNSENSSGVGHIPMEKNGLLSGPYVAINVGVNLWPKRI